MGNFSLGRLICRSQPMLFRGELLNVKLLVDGEEIDLNDFVVKILGGMVGGAVTSLRGIREDWKQIEIKVKK